MCIHVSKVGISCYLIRDLHPFELAHVSRKILKRHLFPVHMRLCGFELGAIVGWKVVLHALQQSQHIFLGPAVW